MPAMTSNGAILYFFMPHERNITPRKHEFDSVLPLSRLEDAGMT